MESRFQHPCSAGEETEARSLSEEDARCRARRRGRGPAPRPVHIVYLILYIENYSVFFPLKNTDFVCLKQDGPLDSPTFQSIPDQQQLQGRGWAKGSHVPDLLPSSCCTPQIMRRVSPVVLLKEEKALSKAPRAAGYKRGDSVWVCR